MFFKGRGCGAHWRPGDGNILRPSKHRSDGFRHNIKTFLLISFSFYIKCVCVKFLLRSEEGVRAPGLGLKADVRHGCGAGTDIPV